MHETSLTVRGSSEPARPPCLGRPPGSNVGFGRHTGGHRGLQRDTGEVCRTTSVMRKMRLARQLRYRQPFTTSRLRLEATSLHGQTSKSCTHRGFCSLRSELWEAVAVRARGLVVVSEPRRSCAADGRRQCTNNFASKNAGVGCAGSVPRCVLVAANTMTKMSDPQLVTVESTRSKLQRQYACVSCLLLGGRVALVF